MKKPIILALITLAIVAGGLSYVYAQFAELKQQTISGQLEDVKKQARELEATLDIDKKFIESTKASIERRSERLQELYAKSNALKALNGSGFTK